MHILLTEPFFTGSHRQWAQGLAGRSRHHFELLTLPGRHWKWRMYGGAVELARQFNDLEAVPDLILATDMLDVATFLALTREKSAGIPVAVYFHENQVTYPWSPTDEDVKLGRDNQYGFVNYTSALVADRVFFNSHFHKNSFLEALPDFLRQFPDCQGLDNIPQIAAKSEVLPLGLNLRIFDEYKTRKQHSKPVLLWNHRWEYDKNPELFFRTLFRLKAEGVSFRLIVLGEAFGKYPPIFDEAKESLMDELIHFGYAPDFATYAHLLWQADILPVTSRQDFFGGSVVEAVYCDCYPLLPKRLAYPEHLPEAVHAAHFYEDEDSFYPALKRLLQTWNELPEFSGAQYVKKYDWQNLTAVYDEMLTSPYSLKPQS